MASVGGILSACTSSAGPAGNADTLNAGLAFEFSDGMDPTKASTLGSINLNNLVFEKLYRTDPFPPRSVAPELATAMPEQLSPTKHRITIRDGVKFHDGKPLTADDVAFTLQRVQNKDTQSLYQRFLTLITKIDVVSPTEIDLTLSSPTSLLADRLALIGIMSKSAVAAASPADLKLHPVGSGPYRVVQAVSQQQVALSRFADYTGKRQMSYTTLNLTLIQDGGARVASVQSGQSQVIEATPAKNYAQFAVSSDPKGGSASPGDTLSIVMMHCGKPPFNDKRVRQALLFAIDRGTITKTSYFDQAVPAWDGVLPANNSDFSAGPFSYRYDPARAKELLAQAGYPNGNIAIDFLFSNAEDAVVTQASVVEQNLRDVGFVPNMKPGGSGLYTEVSAGNYNAMLQTGGPAAISPDGEFVLRWLYYGAVPEQFLFWTDAAAKQVATLLDQAQAAPDENSKKAILADVQRTLQEEAPSMPLHFINGLSTWSARVQGYRPTPSGMLSIDGVKG